MSDEPKEQEMLGCKTLDECAQLVLSVDVVEISLETDILDDEEDEEVTSYGDMTGEYWVDAARQLAMDHVRQHSKESITVERLAALNFGIFGTIDTKANPSVEVLADRLLIQIGGWDQFLRIALPSLEVRLMECKTGDRGPQAAEGQVIPTIKLKTMGDVVRLLSSFGIEL